MSKINIQKTVTEQVKELASNAAVIAMAVAAIIGMTELTDRQDLKVAMTQPAYAFAGDTTGTQPVLQDNSVRKEEVAHRPVSYGITMRSEAISGKR